MRRLTLELIVASALTLGAILASAAEARASDILVTGAFARASATPVAKSGAAYATLRNPGPASDRLTGIATPAAARAELHVSRIDGGIMKMEAVGPLDLPPSGEVAMKPGGLHIMLMGLGKPLVEGQPIDMTFSFEKAGDVTVRVPVGSITADAP